MMQSMKQAISESRKIWDPLTIVASLLLSTHLRNDQRPLFPDQPAQPSSARSGEISLFVCIVLLTLLFAKFTEYVLLKSTSNVIEAVRYPIVAPFATILICILTLAENGSLCGDLPLDPSLSQPRRRS